jgi:hypothetical protein
MTVANNTPLPDIFFLNLHARTTVEEEDRKNIDENFKQQVTSSIVCSCGYCLRELTSGLLAIQLRLQRYEMDGQSGLNILTLPRLFCEECYEEIRFNGTVASTLPSISEANTQPPPIALPTTLWKLWNQMLPASRELTKQFSENLSNSAAKHAQNHGHAHGEGGAQAHGHSHNGQPCHGHGAAASSGSSAVEEIALLSCASCSKLGATSKCAACKSIVYCSKECQRQHWATHKQLCKAIQQQQQQTIQAQVHNHGSSGHGHRSV